MVRGGIGQLYVDTPQESLIFVAFFFFDQRNKQFHTTQLPVAVVHLTLPPVELELASLMLLPLV